MDERFRELTGEMCTKPGATEMALQDLQHKVGVELPVDYLAFLRWSNGATGDIGPNYIHLYSAGEIAADPYPFEEFVPGLLFIADDGAAALFGFDTRVRPMDIVITHSDDLELDTLVPVTSSFIEFLDFLSTHDWSEYWSDNYLRIWEESQRKK